MNDNTQMTSAPGASLIPNGVSALTTIHFAIIAIFAILVIAGLVWGIRLKLRRDAAMREVVRDNRDVAQAPEPTVAQPAPPVAAPAPSPPPVSPAPPPIADSPVVGTPPASPSLQDTQIPATAPLEAAPVAEAQPPLHEATDRSALATDALATDDAPIPVTMLKGLGPKVAARLGELGITDARQLAALDDAQAADLDAALGSFSGRMARDRWIEQARLLSAGDRAGYEATFGKL